MWLVGSLEDIVLVGIGSQEVCAELGHRGSRLESSLAQGADSDGLSDHT